MTKARRGGRPTLAEARELHRQMREAAVSVFLSAGYDGATMEAIARTAGISKPTLYARYPDKRTLFIDVIPWALTYFVDVDDIRETTERGLAAGLLAIGRGALQHARDPMAVGILRIARQESSRFPEFAVSAETMGWSRRQQQVIQLLERHQKEGTIDLDDIELAAEHFLALVEAHPLRLAEFGIFRSTQQEKRHLEFAVKLFLNGILPKGPLRDS